MEFWEIIALFVSAVSVVLAVIAIWLSLHFFSLSTALERDAKESASEIRGAVQRLEVLTQNLTTKLFDLLSGATQSMGEIQKGMLDRIPTGTTFDGEKYKEELDKVLGEKDEMLKKETSRQISEVLGRQELAEAALEALKAQLQTITDTAISESRESEVEARIEAFRAQVLEKASDTDWGHTVWHWSSLAEYLGVSDDDVVRTLDNMDLKGKLIVQYDSDHKTVLFTRPSIPEDVVV